MKRPRKKSKRPPRPREKVLVVLHADGFVEVFGKENIDVHIARRLHVENERGDLSTLLDEYTTATMPRCYRGLYMPNKCREIGNIESITPEQALDTLYELSILRLLRADRESKRQPPAAITRARMAT